MNSNLTPLEHLSQEHRELWTTMRDVVGGDDDRFRTLTEADGLTPGVDYQIIQRRQYALACDLYTRNGIRTGRMTLLSGQCPIARKIDPDGVDEVLFVYMAQCFKPRRLEPGLYIETVEVHHEQVDCLINCRRVAFTTQRDITEERFTLMFDVFDYPVLEAFYHACQKS